MFQAYLTIEHLVQLIIWCLVCDMSAQLAHRLNMWDRDRIVAGFNSLNHFWWGRGFSSPPTATEENTNCQHGHANFEGYVILWSCYIVHSKSKMPEIKRNEECNLSRWSRFSINTVRWLGLQLYVIPLLTLVNWLLPRCPAHCQLYSWLTEVKQTKGKSARSTQIINCLSFGTLVPTYMLLT